MRFILVIVFCCFWLAEAGRRGRRTLNQDRDREVKAVRERVVVLRNPWRAAFCDAVMPHLEVSPEQVKPLIIPSLFLWIVGYNGMPLTSNFGFLVLILLFTLNSIHWYCGKPLF